MLKSVCFGAAGGGKRLYGKISEKYDIIAFVDNDANKWGKELYEIPVYEPDRLKKLEFDYLIITSAPGLESIREQCVELGIPDTKIITSYVEAPLESRRVFLKTLAQMPEMKNLSGVCAEAGVFEGDFAKYINEYFPDRLLHLFDTFEGFDERDIIKENIFSEAMVGEYGNTSIQKVMRKMPYPQQCITHKGYFPNSAEGIKDTFCFVNLDLDLYEPTYKGLLFFADRMVAGGVILIHDYFAENFKGPKEAVDRFVYEHRTKAGIKLTKFPIGDGVSIMLTGF